MLLLVCFAISSPVWGQGTVTIFGIVQDGSGALIPGAEVSVTNTRTGVGRTTVSNESGNYIVTQLPIGDYNLRVQAEGFKAYVQQGISVQVDDNRQINVALELGAVTESVEVAAELVQVETRTGALREVVDSKRIVELPLNGRNPLQLQYLVPGVGGIAGQGQAQNASVSINGSRTNANNYQLDGGDNHDPYFNTPSVFPSPDALDEFSVQTNAYGADRGRNAGAFMSAVTKSGTNQFHGTLFEFLRNEKLNARNFFSAGTPPFRRNQFGGTVGGPIIKEKTFFFFSWQRTIERSAPGAITAVVPTAAQREGNFSNLSAALRDPLGGTFAGNIIPAARLNESARRFLDALVPLPNGANGLLATDSQQKLDDDQYIVKIDHRFGSSNQLSGRLLRNSNNFDEATGNLPGFFARINYENWSLALNDNHIISPTMVNTFSFSFTDIDRRQLSIVPGDSTWNDFGAGFTRTFSEDAPAGLHTQVDGYFNAFSRFPLNHFRQNFQFSNTLSWSKGNHFLKIGADVRRSILDLQEFFRGDPFVRFRNTFTGDAGADLMLGRPTQYEQIAEAANKPRVTELGMFIQDDWKMTKRFTLNLGLRWDPWFPFEDQLNRFAQIRLGEQSTVYPSAPRGLVYPGDPGTTPSLLQTAWGNLGPRFGFAFDPTGNGTSSIRGGYGIFYSQIRQQANNQISTNQPFSLKLTVNNPTGGVNNPYQGVGDPFPFTPPETPEAIAAYQWVTPMAITQWNPNFRNSVVQQWNLNMQRQFFSSWIATVAYVGSKGNHLFMATELNPAIFGAPGNNVNARRPLFPTFANVTDQSSRGNSIYHAMQLSMNKRFSSGLTLLANYTFSKMIDDSSNDGDAPANPFNIRAERAVSDLDRTHRFVGSYIYELPKFAGANALVRHVFGGWETNGIVTLVSGSWMTFSSGRDNSQSAVNQDRADLVGDPFLDTSRPRGELIERYFNTSAFAVNAPGTFGNTGRNIMRGPGDAVVDAGVTKNFAIREAMRIQFRSEFFNILNRVNLGNPNATFGAAQFGRITGAGSPRVIQFALKFMF
ncbi:MAG: carboxypeptidase regulatory-like domain-containing protein [Bryobacterales bacterium]|nr:carboxypeptidase regulatory-like domain-containing protein [Bryobacterales bacterium]